MFLENSSKQRKIRGTEGNLSKYFLTCCTGHQENQLNSLNQQNYLDVRDLLTMFG